MNSWEGWLPIVGLVASGVIAGVASVATKRTETHADTAAKLTSSALDIVQELQEELRLVREDVRVLKREVIDCESRYDSLAAEHRALAAELRTMRDAGG